MLIATAAVRAIKTVNVSVKCFQVLCKSNEDVDDDGDDEDADTQANHDHLLGKETPFGRFIMSSGQWEWNVGEFMRISNKSLIQFHELMQRSDSFSYEHLYLKESLVILFKSITIALKF